MKQSIIFLLLFSASSYVLAQDEGTVVKKARIDRSKGIFVALGPSFTFGKNIGNYSTGFNIEAGYLKRVNRVISIGPSISYLSFKYDPSVSSIAGGDAYVGNGDPNKWSTKYSLANFKYDYGYVLALKGGDLSLTSLAVNIKLNFVPVKDNTVISVYAFVKPFLAIANRSAVSGSDTRYTYDTYEDKYGTTTTSDDLLHYNLNNDTWYPDGFTSQWDGDSYPALKSSTSITGGVFIGPGVELKPAKKFSFFLQAAFGYTFATSFVSTKSYDNTIDSYVNENFPMTKKGFPSVNVQVGSAFNF